MNKLFFTLLFYLTVLFAFGQTNEHHNYSSKAQAITSGIENDSLKVVAIYNWVTQNIAYDYKRYYKNNLKYYHPDRTYRKRKGVCQHIAELFKAMCDEVGIQCLLVPGYTYESDFYIGTTPYWGNHIWNIVQVNGRWHITEPTYGNGEIMLYQVSISKLLFRLFRIKKLIVKKHLSGRTSSEYCFYRSDSAITSNLPILPEFQLLTQNIPLKTWTYGKDSLLKYGITRSTNLTLSGLPSGYHEYFLELGLRSMKYNTRNFREAVHPIFKLTRQNWEYYETEVKAHKKDFIPQHAYLDSLDKRVHLGATLSPRYRSQAFTYHKQIFKHNAKRHKVLSTSLRGKSAFYKKRSKDTKRKRKYFKRRAAKSETSIKNLLKKHKKLSNDNLSRTYQKKNLDSTGSHNLYLSTIKKLNEFDQQIDLYQDSCSHIINRLKSSTSFIDKHETLLDSSSSILDSLLILIMNETEYQSSNQRVFDLNNRLTIEHKQLKSLQKERDIVYTKEIYPHLKEIRKLVSQTIKLHQKSKKLIYNLKRSSSIDYEEDRLYAEENQDYRLSLNFLSQSIKELIIVAKYNAKAYKRESGRMTTLQFIAAWAHGTEWGRNVKVYRKHKQAQRRDHRLSKNIQKSFRYYALKIKKRKLKLTRWEKKLELKNKKQEARRNK